MNKKFLLAISTYKEEKNIIQLIKKIRVEIHNIMILIINDNSSGMLIDDAYFFAAELCRFELNLPKKALKYYEKIIFEYQDSIHLVDSKKYFRVLRNYNELKN